MSYEFHVQDCDLLPVSEALKASGVDFTVLSQDPHRYEIPRQQLPQLCLELGKQSGALRLWETLNADCRSATVENTLSQTLTERQQEVAEAKERERLEQEAKAQAKFERSRDELLNALRQAVPEKFQSILDSMLIEPSDGSQACTKLEYQGVELSIYNSAGSDNLVAHCNGFTRSTSWRRGKDFWDALLDLINSELGAIESDRSEEE